MAIISNKIIEIDIADFQYTGELYINAYTIITSAASAVLKIQNIDKANVIALTTTTGAERTYTHSFAKPQFIKNLKVELFTNIERVILYVDRFGNE